jgi:isoquinoline 1-oxidoreductase beta subunit
MLPIRAKSLKLSRRGFLKASALAGAGLVVGLHLPSGRITTARAAGSGPFEGYLMIAPDSTVTVLAAHIDLGQGSYTGAATLVAEELDAAWSQMRAEGAAGNTRLYGNATWGGIMQGTGGSTGMLSSFDHYRRAGAIARAMLVAAAAAQWGVPAAEITVSEGVISHPNGGKASFGDLVKAATLLHEPDDVELKPASAWRLIGKESVRRIDSVDKTTGRQLFTLDVRQPGMLTAMVVRPPRFGATLASFDASAAKAIKGVVDVVAIPRGVAVVAESTWAAHKGREALKVTWNEDKAETRGSEEFLAEYRRLAKEGQAIKVSELGDVEAAFGGAAKVLEASYEFPYLAHAALEPLDAVASRAGDVVEVWGGHQLPDLYQRIAAEVAGVPPEQVRLHVMAAGGSFGRRAVADGDVIVEAVATARAIGWKAPFKVVWTREDDMTGGRYRPIYFHALKAALSADGRLVAWRHRIVGQSILKGTFFEPFLIQGGIDGTSVEGSQLPYEVPNQRTDLITTDNGVPVLWWRSVGSTHNAYVMEAFIDELAAAAGRDPIEFRLAMLAYQPRHRAVLERVREASGWGTPLPEGVARGVALAESFRSFVAQVAEVRLVKGAVKVERVVCAVDCGLAVNPDVVKAQMEGSIGFGLGAVLKGEITLEGGLVQQSNFDGYDVLRIDEMPKVEVHLVPSNEPAGGAGEPGTPPVGPAVANALAALTGKRIRTLPMSRHKLV